MIIKIKLKTGYFKTQLYKLSISEGNITLTPLGNKGDNILIENNKLKSIGYIKRGNRVGELEIISDDVIYTGVLEEKDNFPELYQIFTKEFGNKFTLHRGAPE